MSARACSELAHGSGSAWTHIVCVLFLQLSGGTEPPFDFGQDLLPLQPYSAGCHLLRTSVVSNFRTDLVEAYLDICPGDDPSVAAHRLCTRWELTVSVTGIPCTQLVQDSLQEAQSLIARHFPPLHPFHSPRRAPLMRAYVQQLAELELDLFQSDFHVREGHMAQVWEKLEMLWEVRLVQDLDDQLRSPATAMDLQASVRLVCEVGFNTGASALFWLATTNATVVSFDLGEHPYVRKVADELGQRFAGRLRVVLGDSAQTVPWYAERASESCDLIIIDGRHTFDGAVQDVQNMARIARAWTPYVEPYATVILLDDVGMLPELNDAWEHAWQRGWVRPIRIVEGSSSPDTFSSKSGVALGHYLGTHLG